MRIGGSPFLYSVIYHFEGKWKSLHQCSDKERNAQLGFLSRLKRPAWDITNLSGIGRHFQL